MVDEALSRFRSRKDSQFNAISVAPVSPAVVTGPPVPASEPAAPRFVVAALSTAGLVAAVMQTLVMPLIPRLPELVHASASDASWVITATLLSAAVCTPVSGRLGDMFGKRRILLCCLGLLVVGAVISASTGSLALMVVGRALQGAAMGSIPLGISLLKDLLPADRQDGAIAFMSSTLGIGGATGLPVSALVAEHFSWHVLFWGAAGLGVLSAIAIAITVPESRVRSGGSLDVLGIVGLTAGLVTLLVAISKGTAWGWTSPAVLGLAAAGLVILPAWGWYQLRRRSPLVDLRTTARLPVLLTDLISIMVGFGMYSIAMIVPQLLQGPAGTGVGLGRSMLVAGSCLAPSGLVMLVGSPLSARLSRARGAGTTLLLGAGVLTVSFVLGLFLCHSVWQLVLVATVNGLGVSFAYSAMPTMIMQHVPQTETAAANGLNALMRSLGTALGSAVMAVLLAGAFGPAGSGTLVGLGAFRVAFAVAGAVTLIGAVLSLFLIRQTRPAAAIIE